MLQTIRCHQPNLRLLPELATYFPSQAHPARSRSPARSKGAPTTTSKGAPTTTSKGDSSPISKGVSNYTHRPAASCSTPLHLHLPRASNTAPYVSHPHTQRAQASKGASVSCTDRRPRRLPLTVPRLRLRILDQQPRSLTHSLPSERQEST